MTKASTKKSKKLLQKRTNLEWALLTILLVIMIFLLLALLNKWWPFNPSQFGSDDLGTAFYTAELPEELQDRADNANDGNAGGTGGNGGTAAPAGGSNGGSNNGGSNGGSNNGGGGTTTPPASSGSALLTFAAGVDTGNTKEQTSGQASGLNENCAIILNSSSLGKQEVCTYTEGDKLVTVTYLNDRVISASRTGF